MGMEKIAWPLPPEPEIITIEKYLDFARTYIVSMLGLFPDLFLLCISGGVTSRAPCIIIGGTQFGVSRHLLKRALDPTPHRTQLSIISEYSSVVRILTYFGDGQTAKSPYDVMTRFAAAPESLYFEQLGSVVRGDDFMIIVSHLSPTLIEGTYTFTPEMLQACVFDKLLPTLRPTKEAVKYMTWDEADVYDFKPEDTTLEQLIAMCK